MKQYPFSRKKRQLKFLAKRLQILLVNPRSDISIQVEKLVLKIKKLLQDLIFVLSRKQLKNILGTAAVCFGISFSNNISAQAFKAPLSNPFGLVATGQLPHPTFADLDGDGDLDLLIGQYYGAMQYFENVGSQTDPLFDMPQMNPFGLTSVEEYAFPVFTDLDGDGDGDADLLVSESYGSLQYFENTGSTNSPQFENPQQNPFGIIVPDDINFHDLADLDGDGDLDLLVGEYYGSFQYYENTGSATNPQFENPQQNPFGLTEVGELPHPSFTDLDGDGDIDLLVSEYYGTLFYFENIGSTNNPQFDTQLENPFDLIEVGEAPLQTFVDLDDDGDMDLLVGVYYGDLLYFENTSISSVKNISQDIEISLFPNPVKNELRIEASKKIEKIEIFNIINQRLVSIKNPPGQIDLNHLSSGMFTVKFSFASGNYAQRKFLKN